MKTPIVSTKSFQKHASPTYRQRRPQPGKELYFKKHKLAAVKESIDIIVTGKPVQAGIDPYNKLIDKNLYENEMNF